MAGSATERVYTGRKKVTLPEDESPSPIGNFIRSVKESISGSTKNIPDDEYEYAEGETDNIPIESSEEEYQEIMGVISPRRINEDKGMRPMQPYEYEDIVKVALSRVKVISGATPEQLEEKVNRYLNAIESDTKLSNVSINDIKFSATQNGYSVLIWMSKV